MQDKIQFSPAEWTRAAGLINNLDSIMAVERLNPNIDGWMGELERAPLACEDYESMWNLFSANLAQMGYHTDFPMLNHRAKLLPATIESLFFLWRAYQEERLELASLFQRFRTSDSFLLRGIEPKHFQRDKLYDSRLTTFHMEYIRTNKEVIDRALQTLYKRICTLCIKHSFRFGLRPVINLAIQAAPRLLTAGPATFAVEQFDYNAGFAEAISDVTPHHYISDDSLWFPDLISDHLDLDEWAAYKLPHRNQFRYHRWHNINAYAVAWNHKTGVTVAVHPKVIHPNFVFHRDSGLITQWADDNADSNWSPLDMYSIHDSVLSTKTDLDEVPGRADSISHAHKLGEYLSLYCQLLTMRIAAVKTGKGSTKPKWSVTPANHSASILTLNLALDILSKES